MTKKMIKNLVITSILLLLFTLAIVLLITLSKKSNYKPREAYDKTGFIDYDETFEDKEFILSNNRFKFTLEGSSTQFNIEDKTTNEKWLSSATEFNKENPNNQNELFILYYERVLETPKDVSVMNESIIHNQFSIRTGKDFIEVLYRVGGKRNNSFVDLPRKIDADRFETLIKEPLEKLSDETSDFELKLDIAAALGQYTHQSKDNTYFLRELSTQTSIDLVYDMIFNRSLYTKEDYIKDNTKYKFPTSEELPYFEFIIRYELTEQGLSYTLINDSIVETEKYQIAYIDILPYFGAGMMEDEGFTIIPDGSGIFIDHNNGKYETVTYNKRIYGQDLSIGIGMVEKPEDTQSIKLPMYGYNKNNQGFIQTINQGAEMTNIVSSFKIQKRNGVLVSKTPAINFRFVLRERDAYEFESNTSKQRVSVWTSDYIKTDFSSEYIFLEKAENYFDYANEYRNYLANKFTFKTLTNEDTLHLTFLGGYKIDKNFIGIPYTTVDYLTKASQINKIISEMNIDKYSVSYQGWSNDGIRPTKMDKIKYNGKVASKKEIKKLLNSMEKENIDFYLEFLAASGYTKERTKIKKNVNYNLMQEAIGYYKYDLASNQFDNTSMRRFQYNNNQVNKNYQSILKYTDKMNIKNIGISDDGNSLSSNFKNKKSEFRTDEVVNFEKNMELLKDKNILTRGSNLYSIINANKVLDVPYEGTLHRMVDYSIPFLQLVLNGNVSYYSTSINLDTSKSIDHYKLKSIETGSRLQFTLSHEDTVKLIKTEYSDIYSTEYSNWIKDIEKTSQELNSLGIYDSIIIGHNVLNKSGTLVEVTYSNGKVFTIDYNTNTFKLRGN